MVVQFINNAPLHIVSVSSIFLTLGCGGCENQSNQLINLLILFTSRTLHDMHFHMRISTLALVLSKRQSCQWNFTGKEIPHALQYHCEVPPMTVTRFVPVLHMSNIVTMITLHVTLQLYSCWSIGKHRAFIRTPGAKWS